jgi:hypothetical protein
MACGLRKGLHATRSAARDSRMPSFVGFSYYHSFISLTSGHVGPFILAARVLSPAGARSFSSFINSFLKFPYSTLIGLIRHPHCFLLIIDIKTPLVWPCEAGNRSPSFSFLARMSAPFHSQCVRIPPGLRARSLLHLNP